MGQRSVDHPHRAAGTRCDRLVARLLVVALAGAILGGCAGTHRTGGSRLSEAAREAKKGAGEKKKLLEAGTPVESEIGVFDVVCDLVFVQEYEDCDDPYVPRDIPPPEEPEDCAVVAVDGGPFLELHYAGFSYSDIRYEGYALAGARTYAARLGLINPGLADRLHAEIDLSVSPVRFGSLVAGSFDGGIEFGVGGGGRYELTPAHTLAGIQLLAGFKAGYLNWSYRNPVWVESENGDVERAYSDGLFNWTPYVGIGLSLLRSRGFNLGADLIAGMTFFDAYTHHGFANDIFGDTGQAQVRLRFAQRF